MCGCRSVGGASQNSNKRDLFLFMLVGTSVLVLDGNGLLPLLGGIVVMDPELF